jgi:hypothetical protein
MKRGVILGILLISLLLVMPLALAAENDSDDSGDITIDDEDTTASQIDEAYACLEDKISERGCDNLPLSERIFALMATGKCSSSVKSSSYLKQCWPESNCAIKTTAQAVIALDNLGSTTSDAEEWLQSQTKAPDNMEWLLQIESNEAMSCSISYSGKDYSVDIGEDKKIQKSAGSCLTLADGNWWLRINPTCYEKEIEISCDKSFVTSLLFKKDNSKTYHVLDKIQSASAEGSTVEKVDSLCFSRGSTCDYEGSLWAAMALKNENEDIANYLPYLISMAEENEKLIPEAFLYFLTGYDDLRNSVLERQVNSQYWDVSEDGKFYDTAVALLPFQYQSSSEKTGAMSWLTGIQGKDGCWDGGNILTNSFLLYALWPEDVGSDDSGGDIDCDDAGFFCLSSVDCDGNILSEYDCSGVFKCCDTAKPLEVCEEQDGVLCSSNEICSGGVTVEAADTNTGDFCCTGSCQEPSQASACELSGGVCRSYGCDDDETESLDSCDTSSDSCCMATTSSGGGNWLWILIFLILIILVVIGIMYREKLKPLWFRMKSSLGGGSAPQNTSGGLPPSSGIPLVSPSPRRMLPPSRPVGRPRRPGRPKSSGDLDDVLKKLKKIGK